MPPESEQDADAHGDKACENRLENRKPGLSAGFCKDQTE